MKLDLNHLEALETVAESGSFAKAAERLNKVRSAVSYDIRCLEQNLGVSLLDRSGYRAELTAAGRILLEEGKYLLKQARSFEHLAGQLSQEWEPSLRLVIDGAIPVSPVMQVIMALHQREIPTVVELETEFLGGVPEQFEKSNADFMLVKDFEVPREHYHVCPLPEVYCVLVAAHDHALFEGNPRQVKHSDLRNYLELNIADSGESQFRMGDKRLGSPRLLNLSGFYMKKEALLLGLGFGWMPKSLVREELESGRLKMVPYDDGPTFSFTPSLMFRKERPLGCTGTLMKDLLIAEFSVLEEE